MPHLIIETNWSLSQKTVEALHQEVGRQESVNLDAVKTRLIVPNFSLAGSTMEKHHTAITLKLLTGRSPHLKEQMANNLYNKARELIPEGSLSVEVVELGTYRK